MGAYNNHIAAVLKRRSSYTVLARVAGTPKAPLRSTLFLTVIYGLRVARLP
jgi:hypothetical protein